MSLQTAVDATNDSSCFKSTLKQRLLVAGVAEGKSIAAAGAAAGYASRQNARDAFVNARDKLLSTMDAAGLTERAVVERLRDQMWATKTVTASFMGEISDTLEIADNAAIGKAIETAAKMRRMIDNDTAPSIGTVNVMFAGALPDWMQGQVAPQPAPQPAPNGNGADIVHTDSRAIAPPPLSAVEGTESDGGGIGQTHSANFAVNCINTVPVVVVPANGKFSNARDGSVPSTAVPAKAKLVSRVTRKRQVRLPVFKP